MNTETNLVSHIQKKDKEAFRYLYEHYFTSLVLFAESYLYDEEEARDCVQDLFFKLWDHSNLIRVDTSFKAYLYNSLRNKCLNILRDRKIHDSHNDKLIEAQLFSASFDVGIDENMQMQLQEALDTLPEKCREILLLKIVENKKNREIAAQLDIAESTVKTQIQRAYKILREKMVPIILLLEWLNS